MTPEGRHRCITHIIIHVEELAQHMLEVKLASRDAEIQYVPEKALQLLSCLPTTITKGASS
jgi:hypothetical protein